MQFVVVGEDDTVGRLLRDGEVVGFSELVGDAVARMRVGRYDVGHSKSFLSSPGAEVVGCVVIVGKRVGEGEVGA